MQYENLYLFLAGTVSGFILSYCLNDDYRDRLLLHMNRKFEEVKEKYNEILLEVEKVHIDVLESSSNTTSTSVSSTASDTDDDDDTQNSTVKERDVDRNIFVTTKGKIIITTSSPIETTTSDVCKNANNIMIIHDPSTPSNSAVPLNSVAPSDSEATTSKKEDVDQYDSDDEIDKLFEESLKNYRGIEDVLEDIYIRGGCVEVPLEDEKILMKYFINNVEGMMLTDAQKFTKTKGFTLRVLYVNNGPKLMESRYDPTVISVKIRDDEYDWYHKTPSLKAYVHKIIDVGGVDSRGVGMEPPETNSITYTKPLDIELN